MNAKDVISKIQEVAHRVLPNGSVLYLFGSRARGDHRDDSDWDLLALLPEMAISKDDKLNLACEFWEQGQAIHEDFNAFVYTLKEWRSTPPSLFKYNVHKDSIKLWG